MHPWPHWVKTKLTECPFLWSKGVLSYPGTSYCSLFCDRHICGGAGSWFCVGQSARHGDRARHGRHDPLLDYRAGYRGVVTVRYRRRYRFVQKVTPLTADDTHNKRRRTETRTGHGRSGFAGPARRGSTPIITTPLRAPDWVSSRKVPLVAVFSRSRSRRWQKQE